MKNFIYIFLFFTVISNAQEDSVWQNIPVQEYKAVPVSVSIIEIHKPVNTLNSSDIEQLQPFDAGDLLQRLPGITLKNYGDIGGLKAISFNGLDAQHNALIINGNKVSNPQTGLVDYSMIRTENLVYLSLSNEDNSRFIPTVDAVLAGNTVSLLTFESVPTSKKFALRFSGLSGSFGLLDGYLAAKVKWKENGFLAASASSRNYNGDFDYSLNTQGTTLVGQRLNNHYTQNQITLGAGYDWTNKKETEYQFRLNTFLNSIDNQLPGAVIAYLPNNDEQLHTTQFSIGAHLLTSKYNAFGKTFRARYYASYLLDSLRYVDPTYFNAEGEIVNQYQNTIYTTGFVHNFERYKKNSFAYGVEQEINQLYTNRADIIEPLRLNTKAFIRYGQKIKRVSFQTRMGFVNVNEQNRNSAVWLKPQNAFLPSITIDYALNSNHTLRLSGKNSFRMPNFNELYYSQIGNIDLQAERANQILLKLTGKGKKVLNWSRKLNYTLTLFAAQIQNKIQTIPTTNSFIWSTQNAGNVASYGSTLSLSYVNRFFGKLDIGTSVSVTAQNTVSRNNKDDINFNQTLAYTPNYLANAQIVFSYVGFKLTTEVLYTGARYSLNQNVNQNLLEAYSIYNATLSKRFSIGNAHNFGVFLSVKNIMNQNNHFVRYFVLPGRNFQLKVTYAFN